MKISRAFLVTGVTAFLVASGCGPINDMKDMKETTTLMKDSTTQMMGTTGSTKDLVGASLLLGREGAGKDARDKAFAAMMDSKQSPDFKKKAVAATSFLYAFEFQTYTGISPDTVELRATLFKPTIEELYWRTNEELNHLSPVFHTNNRLSMAALGAALHRVNYLQKVSPVSVFDLIREGTDAWIQYKNRKVPPSSLTDYQELVAKYIPQTHALLNMRVEGLLLVAIGSLADLCKSSFFSPSLRLFFGLTPSVPVTDTYSNNYFELKFDAEAMDHANTTLDLLERADLPVSVNSEVLSAARKLKLDEKKLAAGSIESAQAHETFQKIHDVVWRADGFKRLPVKTKAGQSQRPAKLGATSSR